MILKALPMLAGLFFIPPVFSLDGHPSNFSNATVGSAHCRRCHEDPYLTWRRAPEPKSCESCHGPGKAHVLAPTFNNVIRLKDPAFHHGPVGAPPPTPHDSVRLDLFVMSHCPFGVAAENQLLPLVKKWGPLVRFKLYFIARERSETALTETTQNTSSEDEKCSADGGEVDGTDRFVSLHGLKEVLEGLRQAVIAEKFPEQFLDYVLERNRALDGDWKKAARTAKFTPSQIKQIESVSDSHYGDSLFAANIAEGRRRKVSGSPTLFINGIEYEDPVAAYPVERLLCQDAGHSGPCRDFPKCGFDYDCRKQGKSGTCVSPGTPKGRCVFEEALRFKITIINDEKCPTCHTGNLIMEMKRRFPGAVFSFYDITSDTGRTLIQSLDLKSYPAFVFDGAVEKTAAFKSIAGTFRKAVDKFVLKEKVVQSYHLFGRTSKPGTLLIFGSFENPPFIEMLRDLESLLTDTAIAPKFEIHPFALLKDSGGPWKNWVDAYDSPYGISEVKAGILARCVDQLYPKKTAYDFKQCRGFDVQKRFESHDPEPESEWKSCVSQLNLDSKKIEGCFSGAQGRALFEESQHLSNETINQDPGPTFLINNIFRIGGYNPAIKKILLEELGITTGK